jgi:hypothetical protein
MKTSEALECIAVLNALYPGSTMQDDSIMAYAKMIEDLDVDACKAAINRLACSNKWFPAIAEIRAEVCKGMLALPDAEVAWGEVRRAIGGYGRNRTPKFSCAELAAAVDVIGWQTICNDENEMSTRARFIDAYRSYRDGTLRVEQLGPHADGLAALPTRNGLQRLPAGAARPDPAEPRGDRQLSPWVQSIVDKYNLELPTED